MSLDNSRMFWDAKAAENPYWYVSSYGSYDERNLEEFWQAGHRIWRDLREAVGYVPGHDDVVVEIGCGVGRLTRAIAADVAHVHAFDISEGMLEVARRSGLSNATFRRGEGDSLAGAPTGAADLAIAYCVFQHLPSLAVLERYLAEMRRVVKPGGIIAFTLSPRTWDDALRPALRVKRWLREQVVSGGPRGLYQREWIGIRPRRQTVHALSPVTLQFASLHGDKWLFWGRAPEDGAQSAARVAVSASAATSRGGRAHAPGFGAS
jgi:ubiquinone/menaquinone biosynthesis C-methylase UbiE